STCASGFVTGFVKQSKRKQKRQKGQKRQKEFFAFFALFAFFASLFARLLAQVEKISPRGGLLRKLSLLSSKEEL
ncbi:hypothetical protein L0337_23740, partial [candidate division KSB1 bacterium]|nr:hypothetical protein [candidate division KSB1 bacterium]